MRIKTSLILLGLMCFMLLISPLKAQTGVCALKVGATDEDDSCNFLDHKIFDWDSDLLRKGIDVESDSSGTYPNRNAFMKIGFDTEEVNTRTWGGNGGNGSPFNWTFNSDTSSDDPIFQFGSNGTVTLVGRFGNTAIGDSDLPPNSYTNLYVHQTIEDSTNTYKGGQFEIIQTRAFPEDSFPAALRGVFKYDSTENSHGSYWGNTRAHAIDGSYELWNGWQIPAVHDPVVIDQMRGINGGVRLMDQKVECAGAAVGIRGGIEIDPSASSSFLNLGACFGTYINLNNGQTNFLQAYGVETPNVTGSAHVDNFVAFGALPLDTGQNVDNFYFLKQLGNEQSLLNGSLSVHSENYEGHGPTTSVKATSHIYWTDENVNLEKLIGYRYDTPSFSSTDGGTCTVDDAYGVYLNQVKSSWTSNFITNGWGIYQEGNDPNYFKGYMNVQTEIDEPEEGASRANYEAGTSISYSDVDTVTISNLYGYLLNSPTFNVTGSGDLYVTNSYGLYLKQMKVSGYNADVTYGWGIYQEGNDDNYFNGKLHTTKTLTASGTPRGRVRLTTNQTGTSDGTAVVIAFTGDVITDNIVFENYHLEVPMNGTYQVSATIRFISVEDDVDYMVGIYVGNSSDPVIASYAHPCSENTSSFSMSVNDLIYLTNGNYIRLKITLPNGTDYFISDNQWDTSMSICLSL